MKKKVLVGMSGGVDSTVAALLLMRDYDVCGVTLLLHGNSDSDAKRVCEKLGIEHLSVNAEDPFRHFVIDNFTSEYRAARTPNPCILCNEHIKFGFMLDLADKYGADYIATGHYSRLVSHNGELFPAVSKSADKDQTYALCRLSQKKLQRSLFPLGELSKDEVRCLAREFELHIAEKDDSQDICFIPDGDYAAYIEERFGKSEPGRFRGPKGEDLGPHKGLIHYTVGQRRGLGIAYSERIFVSRLDASNNEVVLGLEGSQSKLEVVARNMSWISENPPEGEFFCSAKIRYNAKSAPCRVEVSGDRIRATFNSPARGVCPGQSLVLYDGERLLGGGFIE